MAARKDGINYSDTQINAGDEVFDLCCTPCTGRDVNKQASKYCMICKEYFCDGCVKNHNSFRALSGHSMVDPNNTKSTSTQLGKGFHVVPTEKCTKHPMEVITMYCREDDAVGCSICFMLDHKSCEDTHYIPGYIQSNYPTEQVNQINNYLTKAIKAMNKLKTQHDRSNDDNLDKRKVTCKREIQKYREEINLIIDKIEAATLEELDARYNDTKKTEDETNHNIKYIRDEMIRFKSEIESDKINDAQKFVIAKLSRSIMMRGQEMEYATPCDLKTKLTFTRNTDISTFLLSIVTLGMLTPPKMQDSTPSTARGKQPKQTTSTATPSTARSKQPEQTTSTATSEVSRQNKKAATRQQDRAVAVTPRKQGLHKLQKKSEHNIREAENKQKCDITSSCILDGDHILLADYSNNNLKLVDSRTHTIRISLVLDASPNSVCRVSSTEVAVCLDNDTVQFVSTCDGLEPLSALSMKHYCNCIAVIRDIIYISNEDSMYIYTLTGKLKKTIQTDESGNEIFSVINDIALSDNEKMIHVADRDNGVITLNTEGNVVWRFSGTALRRPYGVCTDGDGHVIAGGLLSHNVIQLGPDGQYMGEIVTHGDGLKFPLTLCYDTNKRKLIVGKSNNYITIFTVK